MLSTGAICACDLASVHLFMLSSLCAHDLYLDGFCLSSFWLAVILGENQVMIYPYEHLLIPCLCIWWIRSIGSLPGTRYTLFQLLERNVLLMQTWFVHSPSPPELGWSSRSPWSLVAWMVVCVGSVLAQELDELSLFLLHPYLVDLIWSTGYDF